MPDSAWAHCAYGTKPVGNGPTGLLSGPQPEGPGASTPPTPAGAPWRTRASPSLYTSYDSVYNDLLADAIDTPTESPTLPCPSSRSSYERAINKPAAYSSRDSPSTSPTSTGRWTRRTRAAGPRPQAHLRQALLRHPHPATSPLPPGWTADVLGNEVLTYDSGRGQTPRRAEPSPGSDRAG